MKHLHLGGLSKAQQVQFEAVKEIINSISGREGQYFDYLQTIYNYIQKHLKLYNYKNVGEFQQSSPPKPSKTKQFNQPLFLQKTVTKSRFTENSRKNKSQSMCSNSPKNGSECLQQFLNM